MPAEGTVVDVLRRRATREPDRTALVFLRDGTTEIGRVTYGDLDRQARAAGALVSREARPGDRVLLLLPHGLEYVAAFFGCLYAGVVAIPAYPPRPNQSLARLAAIATDARPALALTTADHLAPIRERFAEAEALAALPLWATDGPEGAGREGPAAAGPGPSALPSAHAVAHLQYTSGSTATPKGVMVTHRNLVHGLEDLARGWEHGPDSILVSWLPFNHDMGLVYGLIEPVYGGFPGYLLTPLSFLQRPVRWLQAISNYRATHTVAPNFGYELCLRKIKEEHRRGLDLSCWRVAVNGAEPVRRETLERFTEAFRPHGFRWRTFCPGYGLAEATLKVTATNVDQEPAILRVRGPDLARDRVAVAGEGEADALFLVGCGGSMVGTRIEIVDPTSARPAGSDAVGEIWVAGDIVTPGYWNRPEETEATFGARLATGEGPFLRTGDLGFLRDGHLYVTGRLKDLVIVRGENHYPQDLERTAEESHPAFRRPGYGVAFAVWARGEERVVLVLEMDRRARVEDPEDVRGAVRQALAEEHALQAWDVVLVPAGTVPRTSSGKVRRRACREAYLEGTLARWTPPGAPVSDAPPR